MKLNTDKYHILLNSQGPNTIKIGYLCIKKSSCKRMLGINFDYKLKFTSHIDIIYNWNVHGVKGFMSWNCERIASI